MAQACGDQQPEQEVHGSYVAQADAGVAERVEAFAAQASAAAAAGQCVDHHYEEVHGVVDYVNLAYY